MNDIYQIKSGQLTPFLNAFQCIGVPVQPLLNSVGLSSKVAEDQTIMIPEYAVWKAIQQVSDHEKIPLLGSVVAKLEQQSCFGQLGQQINNVPNLYTSLTHLIKNLLKHANFQNYWLEEDLLHIKLCRIGTPGIHIGAWQVEQYVMCYFVNLIRGFLGNHWQPAYMFMQSSVSRQKMALFPEVNICYAQPYGVIAIAKSDFSESLVVASDHMISINASAKPISEALTTMIKDEVFGCQANISTVSQATGIHERKIQRLLKNEKTSFRELRNNILIESACHLLSIDNMSVLEIAKTLGYNNANNFSRAFKTATGLSALEYRRLKCESNFR